MTWHATILCEGAQDQTVLASICSTVDGWTIENAVPSALPADLKLLYPRPRENKWGAQQFERPPGFLRSGDRWTVVRQLGGIDQVLGPAAVSFLKQTEPDAVAVVVDANESGVDSRLEAFRHRFGALYPHAEDVRPGTICAGSPRLGLWVAPDNENGGTLLDVLVSASGTTKPKLTQAGKRFVTSLDKVEPGDWSAQRTKAILGAISQTVSPGASLASAIHDNKWLFETCSDEDSPFLHLRSFLRELPSQ